MSAAPALSYAIDMSVLANSAIILITLITLTFGLLTSLVDRRFSAQARALALSEQRYQLLFESNPHPTFVFDLHTLLFLAVNRAAISKYGFSTDEFLSMKITGLQSAQILGSLLETARFGGAAEARSSEGESHAREVLGGCCPGVHATRFYRRPAPTQGQQSPPPICGHCKQELRLQ